jgi:hypothetical protein
MSDLGHRVWLAVSSKNVSCSGKAVRACPPAARDVAAEVEPKSVPGKFLRKLAIAAIERNGTDCI